jgi:hypothetical protein
MDYGAHMKASEGNHARRSAHHGKVKKTPFKGSMRQVRGEVLKAVLAAGGRAGAAGIAAAVARKIGVEREQARAAIDGLARDGMLVKEGARVRVA